MGTLQEVKIINFTSNLIFKFISFLRIFTQTRNDDDDAPLLDNNTATVASDDVDIIIRPETTRINIAGNNILNANLSGSFREENETSSNGIQPRTHRSAPNILQPEPSTSQVSPRRLGVAAIPNNQFLSNAP